MRTTGVRTTVFAAAGAFIGAVAGQALFAGPALAQGQGQAPEQSLAPQFQVDPDWPKQLPNNWQIGQAAGISVGPEGNIWVLHRPRTLDDSEAGATDAEPGIFVCNAGGDEKASIDTCAAGDDFAAPVAADAFGHPRPFGPISDNSIPAPSILKFDPEGNLLDAWGGPEHHGQDWGWPVGDDLWSNAPGVNCEWPANEHGLHVDADMNVYIAGNGFGDGTLSAALNNNGWDGQVLKFNPETRECELMIGGPQPAGTPDLVDNQDTTGGAAGTPQLYRPANMHATTDELIIDDGYGNCRVVVVDKTDGQFKRGWGAYGKPLAEVECLDEGYAESGDREAVLTAGTPPQQFRRPVHCGRPSLDGFVYVCDRVNNRIQVFDEGGNFQFEKFLRPDTLGPGSVWDLAFSSDRDQSCLHNVDGTNMSLDTLFRDTLELLASVGGAGRNAGEFHWVHDIAVDSHGNAYTTEVDTGKRIQKFDRRGRRGCRSN